MAACANASNDTILRSLFLIRHGFPPSSSCPTLRYGSIRSRIPRENPREIIEKIQEEEEGTIVGPFDSKTRALPSVHDAHFHRSFHAYSWRVFNAVSTYRFKGKWPGISNNRATCSSLILRDSPRSASITAPSIRRNMCIRAAISPLPEVYHHCIEAGKRCRCITVITTRSGNRTTEKPYPQFLRPFRERFYLQSTGFTNRVAHRFFLSQPFSPLTIHVRSHPSRIVANQFSVIILRVILRMKRITWKMVLHESNIIIISNAPTLCMISAVTK